MRTVSQVDEYLAPIATELRVSGAHAGLPGFAERIVVALRTALLALNEVPETDTLWLGTNRRPTVYKLGRYLLGRLRDDATDELARWGLVALDCYHGADGCGWALLAARVAASPQAAVDAMSVATWCHHCIGDIEEDHVRTVLAGADRAGIEQLVRDGACDERTRVAGTALRVLDGGRIGT
jgi:hypothetical protein